jgi:hypothetical protein
MTEKLIDKSVARKKRGQTTPQEDSLFSTLSNTELFALINDEDPGKRTSAIKTLGVRKNKEAIPFLCDRLLKETALYSRLAIGESLAGLGDQAIPDLVGLIGKVGNNRHSSLPRKEFGKTSYPLPRDMAVRILIRIGSSALEPLEKVIISGDRNCILEAIDGVGHIAYYCGDLRSESVLVTAFQKYQSDQLIVWKIVRAFQVFPTGRIHKILEAIICENPYSEIRLEAVRSLGQHKLISSSELGN